MKYKLASSYHINKHNSMVLPHSHSRITILILTAKPDLLPGLPTPGKLLICSILWGLCTQHQDKCWVIDSLTLSFLPSYSGRAWMLSATQTSWMLPRLKLLMDFKFTTSIFFTLCVSHEVYCSTRQLSVELQCGLLLTGQSRYLYFAICIYLTNSQREILFCYNHRLSYLQSKTNH